MLTRGDFQRGDGILEEVIPPALPGRDYYDHSSVVMKQKDSTMTRQRFL